MFARRLIYWFLASVLFCCAGCGDKGPQRYQFAGKVTYQGQPVPAGIMYFDPDVPGNDGPQGHATIKDGAYDTRLLGNQGPGGGRYLVRIYAHDGVPVPELPMGKLLFPEVIVPKDLPKADGPLDIVVPPQK
jgi:hypothetical protein